MCDYVFISGYHDYRSQRKADLHFIADNLKSRGRVAFLSMRYSRLSRYRQDPRHDLRGRANRLELHDDVLCFLRYTSVHPMRLPARLGVIERALFRLYAVSLPGEVRALLRKAKIIFVESGIAITLIAQIKRLNPASRIIYLASDSLEAIRQADTIRADLQTHASSIEAARVPSPLLKSDIPPGIPTYFIPHGIEKQVFDRAQPSPFGADGINAVSVGSMLFDPTFFDIAGAAFPHITFHVIGSGHSGSHAANVIYHPEMPFAATIPFLQHSRFAVAAYGQGLEPYLKHTSMKLMQYRYLGLPAVCANTVASPEVNRFGYQAGDEASIRSAIEAALAAKRLAPGACLSWAEVTDRLLAPTAFPDTQC